MNAATNTVAHQPTIAPLNAAAAIAGIALLVEEAVESRIRNGNLFTTLDISNEIKRKRYAVRHKAVSEAVRELFTIGAMQTRGYDRVLIEVNTEGGEKTTEAFLYLPTGKHPSDYAGRVQDALPPLDGSAALDPAGYVPLYPPTLRAQASGKIKGGGRRAGNGGGKRSKFRRDGALPVPRSLVQQAGWNVGDLLTLVGSGKTLRLAPTSGAATTGKLVKVWADFRVRIAKTKMDNGVDVTAAQIKLKNGAVEVAWS